MAKRATGKRRRQVEPTLEERGERYERAILLRRREHQRRVTMLARGLRRATDVANRERVQAARELLAGTSWQLIDPAEFARWQRQHDDAERRLEELAAIVKQLECER